MIIFISCIDPDIDLLQVDKLKELYPIQVMASDSPEYRAWSSDIWSNFQAETVPACVFQPASTDEVAIAILLCRWARCRFAVKSGGHAAMKDASNSDGGITIDLRKLGRIELSEDKKIAKLGTGARWIEVYKELEKHGLAVIGGRHSDIGVGGFLLGGKFTNRKLSFLTVLTV
jgi:FAD/FMN-containing dehydrogenase